MRIRIVAVCLAFAAIAAAGQPAGHCRALLVGINDYTASRLGPPPKPGEVPDRDWTNLTGAVNDVNAFREILHNLYGFDPRDIVTLIDQDATRENILAAIDNLAAQSRKGDVVFFYYAGHGSQVKNSYSDEIDKLDESLVPADTRLGVRDIRDKELRSRFNAILDRGAGLTIILDSCHSGSGARGLSTGAHARGVRADEQDVKDRIYGPRPEDRGAIVMTASHDDDTAWETRGWDHNFHGAFSWAWIRALSDAPAGEPLEETFMRAQARMRGESPYQNPNVAGPMPLRLQPFLGQRIDRRDDRVVVAVEKTLSNGTVVLQGGWANGLTEGTELQFPGTATRLAITSIRGLSQCEAQITAGGPVPAGAVLEVSRWQAPRLDPLRVWMPKTSLTLKEIATFAQQVIDEAKEHGINPIPDPIEKTPKHILRYRANGWELAAEGAFQRLGGNEKVLEAIAELPRGSTLFLQLPAPGTLIESLDADGKGVISVDGPDDADYILVGRLTTKRLCYSWMRPAVKKRDRRTTGLPLHTKWIGERRNGKKMHSLSASLAESLATLRRIHAWQSLQSPPGSRYPYHIALRHERTGDMPRSNSMTMKEKYRVALRPTLPFPAKLRRRFVYVFVIDSNGKSTLLYPEASAGSAENHFPLDPNAPPPTEIDLGDESEFQVVRPLGVDNFYVLSTDEPLPNPELLQWDGVRAPPAKPSTPLEQLLAALTAPSGARSPLTPPSWSIDHVLFETVPSHTTKNDD